MKKLFLVSIFIFSLGCELNNPITEFEFDIDIEEIPEEVEEVTEWDVFVEALIQVESEGNPFAVGKTNDLGILQITPIYVKDVNRILGEERFTLDCRIDIDKSLEMFEIYQSYYNPDKDIHRAIKLHNPGAGSDYREKILSKINELKQSKMTRTIMNENPNTATSASQTKQILEYLQQGNTITPLEALRKFGCLRLTSRIWDIEQLTGIRPKRERVKVKNAQGQQVYVMQYWI